MTEKATNMEPNKLVSYKSYKCERLIDKCSYMLGFLAVSFESMSETEPKVDFIFLDGLKAICDNMTDQLCDAHDLTVEIRGITGEMMHEEFVQIEHGMIKDAKNVVKR